LHKRIEPFPLEQRLEVLVPLGDFGFEGFHFFEVQFQLGNLVFGFPREACGLRSFGTEAETVAAGQQVGQQVSAAATAGAEDVLQDVKPTGTGTEEFSRSAGGNGVILLLGSYREFVQLVVVGGDVDHDPASLFHQGLVDDAAILLVARAVVKSIVIHVGYLSSSRRAAREQRKAENEISHGSGGFNFS